jgi:hypothetical protein
MNLSLHWRGNGCWHGFLDLKFRYWRLTSALISAVQQIAKGKMFSSAIIVMMIVCLVFNHH